MLSWIGSLLGLLPAALNTINGITSAISNEKIALINAKTDQERIKTQEHISTLEARRDLMISDGQQSHLDIYIRSLIAIGPTCYLLKIFIWDKVLQAVTAGSTDPLDANLWAVVTAVLGFYLLTTAAITTARIIKA